MLIFLLQYASFEPRYIPYEYIARDKSRRSDSSQKIETAKVVDLPPLPFVREDESSSPEPEAQEDEHDAGDCDAVATRPYELGETLRSQDDVIDRRMIGWREHYRMVSNLQLREHAFIKRADGSFSYGNLVRRYVDEETNEDTLVFALNGTGSMKYLPMKKWKSCVRVERRRCVEEANGSDPPDPTPRPEPSGRLEESVDRGASRRESNCSATTFSAASSSQL